MGALPRISAPGAGCPPAATWKSFRSCFVLVGCRRSLEEKHMEIMLAALALLWLLVVIALGVLLARAVMARLKAERDLAAARQQLVAGEQRLADFERLKQESLLATKAALIETGQQLS